MGEGRGGVKGGVRRGEHEEVRVGRGKQEGVGGGGEESKRGKGRIRGMGGGE
jgi:hypothetical protein